MEADMPDTMSRRSAMGVLGASGLAGAGVGGAAITAAAVKAVKAASGPPAALRVGARFGRWTIVEVHPVERGALQVDVEEADGHRFSLEILARDPSAVSRPPAQVGELAVYVCNGGDGWLPTVEEQGLAAMTLGLLLEKHEQTGAIDGLLTHGQRVVAHGDVLSASYIAAA
jgi:hypothetical protein